MTWEWRHLRIGETDHEALWTAVAAALVVLFTAWIQVVDWPPIVCPFHALTGLPCPTCGATRALFAFAHGDLGGALRLNPLVGTGLIMAVPYVAYAGVVSVFRLPRLRLVSIAPRSATLVRATVWVVIAATWVFLIADGR